MSLWTNPPNLPFPRQQVLVLTSTPPRERDGYITLGGRWTVYTENGDELPVDTHNVIGWRFK